MTDSPAFSMPLDPAEKPILDSILGIREHLSLLKSDRSTYVKSADVVNYYNQLIEQVERLNTIRVHKRDEQNRVDTVLDDCFQLISLFFLTIGRNHEAPAIYSAVSTVKRLLDHLKEAGFYSPKDLASISSHVQEWDESIERSRGEHSESMITLLKARIDVCRRISQELRDTLSQLDPEMMDTYEKLVSILRSLSACNTRTKFPTKEVNDFRAQLVEVQAQLHEAPIEHEGRSAEDIYAERLKRVHIADGEVVDGRSLVRALLARCLLWVEIIEDKQGKISSAFQDTYDKLLKVRNALDQMNLTQAWSLRETDLYAYQRQLDRVDEARVNGNFVDAEGRPADLHAQRTLLYLLRKSYSYIYIYIISSEPVSEALLPIYNQLLTLKRCLEEVKKSGGVDSPRELYPYSMKLNSIDNMKKDGKFMIGNDIPEGQGAVSALLAECFDLAYDLRNEADEKTEAREAEHAGSLHSEQTPVAEQGNPFGGAQDDDEDAPTQLTLAPQSASHEAETHRAEEPAKLHLLTLPPEIRLTIWELVTHPPTLEWSSGTTNADLQPRQREFFADLDTHKYLPREPVLLQVSQFVRNDALAVWLQRLEAEKDAIHAARNTPTVRTLEETRRERQLDFHREMLALIFETLRVAWELCDVRSVRYEE